MAFTLAGAAATTLAACGGEAAEQPCTPRASLIPAYVTPDELNQLVRSSSPSALVIVNPDNGPGVVAQRGFAEAIVRLRRAGMQVLGYVPTDYGTRAPGAVRADIDLYASWYRVSDIFVDEVASTDDKLPYYASLTASLRAGPNRLVVFNPGMVPAAGYFRLADIVVTFEGRYADYQARTEVAPSGLTGLATAQTANLVYDATDAEALRVADAPRADYVYVNSGIQPNPWRSLPPTLPEQQALLADCD